jgi:hypothetical protein
MQSIKKPVIVAEGLDILFYDDIEDAEKHLEPIDVDNGIYVAYDADGRLLKIQNDDNKISISIFEQNPTHRKSLEDLLRKFLDFCHDPAARDNLCTLSGLIEASRKFAKF